MSLSGLSPTINSSGPKATPQLSEITLRAVGSGLEGTPSSSRLMATLKEFSPAWNIDGDHRQGWWICRLPSVDHA
eukprot:5040361-Pyramimonas_sp.AAC.1